MSKCPHCQSELRIADCVYGNVETYGKSALASTECCSRGVWVSRRITFNIAPYSGDRTQDDWGDNIIQEPKDIPVGQINEAMALTAFTHFQCNELTKGLDVIRGINDPLSAAWVVQDVLGRMGSSMTQTKNWLINALYNGK